MLLKPNEYSPGVDPFGSSTWMSCSGGGADANTLIGSLYLPPYF